MSSEISKLKQTLRSLWIKYKFLPPKIRHPLTIFALLIILYSSHIFYLTLKIAYFQPNLESTKIFDRDGEILYEVERPAEGYANYVELKDINPDIIRATILLEDKSFYSNSGIDIPRIFKCLSYVFSKNKPVCGASTITQQYVKIVLNHRDRTIWNKLQEISISIPLNFFMSKEEILERYLNSVYFSNMHYGVESASKGYFGKSNKDLDIAQAAFLAGIPNSPVHLDPYLNFETAKARQNEVLNVLVENEVIKSEDVESLSAQNINLVKHIDKINAPHFVLDLVGSYNDENPMPSEIHTTLSLDLYRQVSDIVDRDMKDVENKNATNSAVVVMDVHTGEVLVLVGSKDFFATDIDGQVNAANSLRNPGSTLKPFTYSLSFDENFTPATIINDREQILPDSKGRPYVPQNFDKDEHGNVTVRSALANSFNIPAVVTLKETGVDKFYNLADHIGLEEIRKQDADVALTLGGCSISLIDLTNAYRIFPNGGNYLGDPVFVKEENKKFENNPNQVLGENGEEISYLISNILSDNDARRYSFGSLSKLDLPFTAYVKTGTAQNFTDSWTVGYTSDFVVGVWMGNNDNSPMDGITGIEGAGDIWHDVMKVTYDYYKLHEGKVDFTIAKPDGVVSEKICPTNGEIYSESCKDPSYVEYFITGKTPASANTKKFVDVLYPDLISITDPYDGDTFYFEEGLKFPVEFVANSDFDEYILNANGIDIAEVSGDAMTSSLNQNEPKSIVWTMQPGDYEIKIVGIKNGKRVESESVRVRIES